MILAADIGNTSICIGTYDDGGNIIFISSFETDINRTRDQYAIDLLNIFRLYKADIDQVTGSVISSVVPPLTAVFAAAVMKLTDKAPLLVGPGTKTGLNIQTEIHSQLGSDIVASCVSVMHKYELPAIIIDMGTATTISLVGRGGMFIGCSIYPGVKIALEALSERAAQLPEVSIDAPTAVMGKNTIDSMHSGIIYGSAGMLDSMISRIEDEYGIASAVVGTGGNAKRILKYCRRRIQYDANLLLDGLYQIYMKNPARIVKNK